MRNAFRKASGQVNAVVQRWADEHQRAFVTFQPAGEPRGRALLAYVVGPYLQRKGVPIPTSHTHFGESVEMVAALLELGYAVDVISYRNTSFVPRRRYDLFVAARTNFELIAKRLGDDCLKIVHLDTAHWLFNNSAASSRCLEVQRRRRVTLTSYRLFEPTWAIEAADCATMLGNAATYATYEFANKPVFQLPVPACELYDSPAAKDFEAARSRFVWLGSRGLVHKGLDVVLEAFAEMPEVELYVCGPIDAEPRFKRAFHRELHETPNIHTLGWTDVAGPAFRDLINRSVGLVYPSCAEGCAGSVVTAMQAGLIPLVTREAGVDIDATFGVELPEISAAAVQRCVTSVANLEPAQLRSMATRAWSVARATYTRDRYRRAFRDAIEAIVTRRVGADVGFVPLVGEDPHELT